MPAIATLTVNDGLSTPVAHAFAPVTTDGSKAQFADRSPSIPAGFRTISHEMLLPNGTRTVYQINMGFMIPVVAVVDGSDKVVRYSSAQVKLNIHPDATVQERKDLLAYVANSLGLATVKTSVENLEPYY